MEAIRRVAKISFEPSINYTNADIKIGGISGNWINSEGYTILGRMHFPGTISKNLLSSDYHSYLLINSSLSIISARPEEGGGHFGLALAFHELGHGLGLGHPHDIGNGTTRTAHPKAGPEPPYDVIYDNERYTIMSYESGGWHQNKANNYGHVVTPMALDIFALQNMYGATSNNEGNTTYKLTDEGSAPLDVDGSDGSVSIGRAFFSIWDTGGTDEITYGGSNRVVLNLNNASLSLTHDTRTQALVDLIKESAGFKALPFEIKNNLIVPEHNAAGNFSTIFDSKGNVQLGGFSIAPDMHNSKAKIEYASGGSGDDIIVGNEEPNRLTGNDGNDLLLGSDGTDQLLGGAGNDELGGGGGHDELDGGPGEDIALFSDVCSNYELDRNSETGIITISHVSGTKSDGVDTLENIERAKFKDGTIDLTASQLGCPPIDFIFLVDLSASFADDLPNFVASAPAIFDAIRAKDPNARFAISSFVDKPEYPFGDPGDYIYRPELALTADLTAFQSTLNNLTIKSGGDSPESQWAGLWGAANGIGLNLRNNSRKIILIATDASAHSASDYGLNEATILQFLIDNSIATIDRSAPSETTEPAPSEIAEPAPSEIEDIIDPTDVGDTNPDYVKDLVDPLIGEAFSTVFGNATVLFALTTDAESFYETEVPDHVASAIAPLSSSGEDIADAVRLALESVAGKITEKGENTSDDLIIGTPDNDGLFGLGGNDTILGRAGNDVIDGGSGDDRLVGGEGDDDIRGGSGNDVIIDGIGNDHIDGGDGADKIYDFSGTNEIRGGTGDDLIMGGFHEDTLHGNAGNDELHGGAGNDTFVFAPGDGLDTIEDFAAGEDHIDLRQFPHIFGLSDLMVTSDEKGTTIYLDEHRESGIRLKGFIANLDASDFVFAEAKEDDFSADTTTEGRVAVDSPVTGTIETEGDEDWFVVELVAGRTYMFDLEGAPTERGTLENPYLSGIYDADGNLVSDTTDDNGGVSTNSRVTFTPTEGGTYYVAASAYESYEGTYTVAVMEVTESSDSVSEAPGEDLPTDTTTTGRVAVEGTATGTIGTVGDLDWFAVELVAGRTYELDLESEPTGRGTLEDPYLAGVYDNGGNLISDTTDDDGGILTNSRVTFTPIEDGTYYVAASAYDSFEGTYRIAVTDVTELSIGSVSEAHDKDLPADTTTKGRVAVDGRATGAIGMETDEDWFAVELVAGRTYEFDLEGEPTGRGTLEDPYLTGIYDADGNLISDTTDDDGGYLANSRVTFTPTEDGTYYVATAAYVPVAIIAANAEPEPPADELSAGMYTVSVTDVTELSVGAVSEVDAPGEDLPADTTTMGSMAVNGRTTGRIWTGGDQDWFAVELVADQIYEFNLEGEPTGRGTLEDPYLTGIYDADGNLIADTTNDDGGISTNSRVTFAPTENGIYYVAASAFASGVGNYTLFVEDVM